MPQEFLGQVPLKLTALKDATPLNSWFDVIDLEGHQIGNRELHLTITFDDKRKVNSNLFSFNTSIF